MDRQRCAAGEWRAAWCGPLGLSRRVWRELAAIFFADLPQQLGRGTGSPAWLEVSDLSPAACMLETNQIRAPHWYQCAVSALSFKLATSQTEAFVSMCRVSISCCTIPCATHRYCEPFLEVALNHTFAGDPTPRCGKRNAFPPPFLCIC